MNNSNCLVLASLVLLTIFTSCSNRCCDLIAQSLEKQCSEEMEECSVSFKETFDIEWNTLYIFDSMLYPKEVSEELGIKYYGDIIPEGNSLFIFIHNGNIVKEQISRCSNVMFVDMKEDGVVKISNKGTYIKKRKMINDKVHYLLYAKK